MKAQWVWPAARLPSTAAKMGYTDLFNPEESIKAGTEYLLLLQNMFRGKAADKNELYKFTLAAYNAGEGRIMDCIRYAESVGADSQLPTSACVSTNFFVVPHRLF